MSRDAVSFNPPLNTGDRANHSQFSDMQNNAGIKDARAGGILSSIEANSQQARDLLTGGDIRIPHLGDQKKQASHMHGTSRDESFDIGSK